MKIRSWPMILKFCFKILYYILYREVCDLLEFTDWGTCSRQGQLLYNHYKTFSFIICVLESRVREATASVRRTQLAQLASSFPRGPVTKLGQLTREQGYTLALLEPFSPLFSITGVNQGDL
jgi:hypothetical protein